MFYIKELPMTDSNVQIHTDLFSLSPCFKLPKYLNTLISPKIKISNCNICFSNEIWGKGTETFFNPHHLSTQPMALLADLGQFILGSADVIPESLTKRYTCCWLWLQKACLWLQKVCCMFCRPNLQPRLTHSMVLVTMARSTLKKPPPYRWMQGCLIGRSKCTYGGTLPLSPWKVNPLCQPQPRDPARHQGLSWTCFPAPPGQPYHLSIFQFLTSCIPPIQAWSNLAYSFDLSLQVTTYSLFYCKSLNHSIKHAQTKGKHSKC